MICNAYIRPDESMGPHPRYKKRVLSSMSEVHRPHGAAITSRQFATRVSSIKLADVISRLIS